MGIGGRLSYYNSLHSEHSCSFPTLSQDINRPGLIANLPYMPLKKENQLCIGSVLSSWSCFANASTLLSETALGVVGCVAQQLDNSIQLL